MSDVLNKKYLEVDVVKNLADALRENTYGSFAVSGMSGSLPSCIISSVHSIYSSPVVIILPDKEEAAYVFNDLQELLPQEKVLFFPSSSQRFSRSEALSINTLDRSLVLKALEKPFKSTIVTYSEAI